MRTQKPEKKVHISYLSENGEKKHHFAYLISVSDSLVMFRTYENTITIPVSRLLKIRESDKD